MELGTWNLEQMTNDQFTNDQFTNDQYTNKLMTSNLMTNDKMKQFILYLTLIILIPNTFLKSQESNLHMVARPLPDSIILRWAPVNYTTWNLGNHYGYKLVRYTLVRDSLVISKPEITNLNANALKPYELYSWEPLVKSNKYAAIAAQALYGKTFQIDAGEGFNPQNVYYKAKEQEQRFAFALYAADLSPTVARASALWFADKTAKKNEKYLYRVFIDLPDSLRAYSDTAFVFTGISEYYPLPAPVEFDAEFENKIARLRWNILAQNNIYIAWEIERSHDKGRNYKPISPDFIVPFFEGDGQAQEYSFKFDSLPQNGTEYWYRLRGISSFGEYGPWSAVIKGKGIEAIDANPNITGHQMDKKSVILNWEFPASSESKISGFKVLRSSKHNSGFTDISKNIKPNKRQFTDKKPLGTAYYKVQAYRDTVAEKLSYPYLVQLTDSIPPHKPSGLTGIADTSGIIKLNWKPNTDDDIYGYLVFRSTSGKDEYTLLNSLPIEQANFTDSIQKQDLNSSVFYKVAAVDQRQNQSELSKVFEVLKPDIIPPSMPVFTDVKPTNNGVSIKWTNSSSLDVAKHMLFRQYDNEQDWSVIAEIPVKKGETIGSYNDMECTDGRIARYKIMAVDKSGNTSKETQSIDIKCTGSIFGPEIKSLQKQVNTSAGKVLVYWEKQIKPVIQYKIYRKENEGVFELYSTMEGINNQFEDSGLKLGNTYTYRIKAYYEDGSISPFSKEVELQF